MVETIIDQLKNIAQIEHTRHRCKRGMIERCCSVEAALANGHELVMPDIEANA